jgi:hypothetical protein
MAAPAQTSAVASATDANYSDQAVAAQPPRPTTSFRQRMAARRRPTQLPSVVCDLQQHESKQGAITMPRPRLPQMVRPCLPACSPHVPAAGRHDLRRHRQAVAPMDRHPVNATAPNGVTAAKRERGRHRVVAVPASPEPCGRGVRTAVISVNVAARTGVTACIHRLPLATPGEGPTQRRPPVTAPVHRDTFSRANLVQDQRIVCCASRVS